jgi:hypothetical protein
MDDVNVALEEVKSLEPVVVSPSVPLARTLVPSRALVTHDEGVVAAKPPGALRLVPPFTQ